jgi:TonB family protein
MNVVYRSLLTLAILCGNLHAQESVVLTEKELLDYGILRLKEVSPRYTQDAIVAQIRGNVVLEITIDTAGHVTNTKVISPLGYGLDEESVNAASQWTFTPPVIHGKPVLVKTTVLLGFRGRSEAVSREEEQRTRMNVAMAGLSAGGEARAEATFEIHALADEKYPPAMHYYAMMLSAGAGVPADRERAMQLMKAAADKKYPPAVFMIGRLYAMGQTLPRDAKKGRTMTAASLGSTEAQLYLGAAYETGGDGYPKDADTAQKHYRSCAMAQVAEYQFRLARVLLEDPARKESDTAQAIAWLKFAQAGGNEEAVLLLRKESATLSDRQLDAVEAWTARLRK